MNTENFALVNFFYLTLHLFEKIHTDDNECDMLTKVLRREKLEVYCLVTGMTDPCT